MAELPEIKIIPNPKEDLKKEQDRKTTLELLQETKVLSKRQARMADLLIDPPESKSQKLLSNTLSKGFDSLTSAAEGFIGQVPVLGTGIISLTKGLVNISKERKEAKIQELKERRQRELELAQRVKEEREEAAAELRRERMAIIERAQSEAERTNGNFEELLEKFDLEAKEQKKLEIEKMKQQELALIKLEAAAERSEHENELSESNNFYTKGLFVAANAMRSLISLSIKSVKKVFFGIGKTLSMIASGSSKLVKLVGAVLASNLALPIALASIASALYVFKDNISNWLRNIDTSKITIAIEEIKGTLSNIGGFIKSIGVSIGRGYEDLKLSLTETFDRLSANFDIMVEKLKGALNPFGDNKFKINQAEERKRDLIKQQKEKRLQISEDRRLSDEAEAARRLQEEARRQEIIRLNTPSQNSTNITTAVNKKTTNYHTTAKSATRLNRSPKIPSTLQLGIIG